MLTIGGLVFMLACVFGSYTLAGGSMAPLIEAMPFELLTIGGAAIATFVMATACMT
jgi:chemotaxis protein MotA